MSDWVEKADAGVPRKADVVAAGCCGCGDAKNEGCLSAVLLLNIPKPLPLPLLAKADCGVDALLLLV